jgi:acetoin utilization deacetylase AcuC-like enzyme
MDAGIGKTAIIDSKLFDDHIPQTYLPESPMRTQIIRTALKKEFVDRVVWVQPQPIEEEDLKKVHRPTYVNRVIATCKKSDDTIASSLSKEVEVTRGSLRAILHAAGAAQQAVRLIMDDTNEIERVFCNIRPPGHHASRGKCEGFCVFNNIYLACVEARKYVSKIAIVDWDVHHGNGTQKFILNSPQEQNTLFFSIHQHHKTLYPGTGKSSVRGHYGTVRCGEMQPQSTDADVKKYFKCVLLPKMKEFAPEIILISCGFDGHEKDHMAKLNYSSELYGWMTKQLLKLQTRMVSVLEGGYNSKALYDSSISHVKSLVVGPTLGS